ncbi:MAG: MoaD/ThiS family protein [Candidatus Competibacterales bacterium]
MAVRVRFLAGLGQRLGRSEAHLDLDFEEATTIQALWQRLCPDTPMPPNTLTAVNFEYRELDHPVTDGDEVAFFPPVTGG